MAWKIIFLAIATRVLIAVVTQTFFQPDEYYQSLEVAHRLVFGYGHLTWEWLTPKPIRSIVYPLLNVPIYTALKQLRLDDTRLLVGACNVFKAQPGVADDLCRYGALKFCMELLLPSQIFLYACSPGELQEKDM